MKVAANSVVTISNTEELGGKEDIGSCTDPISEIQSIIALGRGLKFNPTDEKYWKRASEKTKKIPARYHHTCTLTISGDDIQ